MEYFVFCDVNLHLCHEVFIGFLHVKNKPFIDVTVIARFEPNFALTLFNTHTPSTNVTAKPRTHYYCDVTRRPHLLQLQNMT